MALDESPWRYYLQTIVQFKAGDRSGTVVPLDDAAGGESAPLGPLHVIAAVQPGSHPASAENAARMGVLDHELRQTGIRSICAVGSGLDGRHAEESRAVLGLSDADARALGVRFGQVAIFAWNGPRWSLLACAVDRHTHRAWQWTPSG